MCSFVMFLAQFTLFEDFSNITLIDTVKAQTILVLLGVSNTPKPVIDRDTELDIVAITRKI